MSEARREGIEQGLEKGKKEGIEVGKNQIMNNTFAILDALKANALSMEQIAEKYNVKIEYVQQMKKYSN